jgi:hypothetical protein
MMLHDDCDQRRHLAKRLAMQLKADDQASVFSVELKRTELSKIVGALGDAISLDFAREELCSRRELYHRIA